MTDNQKKFVEKYNQNPELIEKVYNKDRGEMLKFIISQNLLDYVDEEIFEDYLDLVLYERLNNASPENKVKVMKSIAENYLNDIVFEGDKIYYDADKDDLDQIFYDGRDGDRYIVNKILSLDDDWWEPYSDVVDDRSFFNECIGELTNENKMLLSNRLNDELLDVKVNPNTDLLEEIAQEQGHEDYVLLDVDLIHDRILEDEDTTKFLLLDETDIGNELMWRYNDAYNQVAVDGYYNQVMNGISTFFNSDKNPERYVSKYVSKYTNKEVLTEKYRVDVTRSFYDFLMKYLSNWKDSVWTGNIDYYGTFTLIIKILIDWGELDTVSIRTDDYADYREVEKVYNEIIVGDVI